MSAAPLRWLEVSVPAPAEEEGAALVVEALLELGCGGALERDGRIVGYVAEPVEPEAVERALHGRLDPAPHVSLCWIEHEDWAETWKAGLGPRRVGRRLLIAPSWDVPPLDEGDLLVVIDPGMAFGTAEHGTTRGCLRLLERAVGAGERVLDVGAGSGILSVAAVRLGAGGVVAVEADPLSHETLAENVVANGVADVVSCVAARVDADDLRALGPVDGVVANLDATTLRALGPGLRDALRPGGWLVLSGVTAEELPVLREEMEAAGLGSGEVDADGEWRTARFLKPRA